MNVHAVISTNPNSDASDCDLNTSEGVILRVNKLGTRHNPDLRVEPYQLGECNSTANSGIFFSTINGGNGNLA